MSTPPPGGPPDTSPDTDTRHTWHDWFPHPDTYENQQTAIQDVLRTLDEFGFLSMEGACGTGKTVISLTAAVTKLRSESAPFNRIVAATPLKNQTEQFVDELATINANRPNGAAPISGLMMVGFNDLHPYLREDLLDVYTHAPREMLQDMRERTAELISIESSVALQGHNERPHAGRETWYDPTRADQLCQYVRNMVASAGEITYEREYPELDDDDDDTATPRNNALSTDNVLSPYPRTLPETRNVVDLSQTTKRLDQEESGRFEEYESGELGESSDDSDTDRSLPAELDGPFDPFFAGFFAQDPELRDSFPVSFADAHQHVLTKTDLLDNCVSEGICPHLSMSHLASDAPVIIGNYNHVFDPMTRFLTQEKLELFSEGTILIVDEAHNLEARARDLFSSTIAPHTLKTARNDIRGALQLAAVGDIESLYSAKQNDAVLKDEDSLTIQEPTVRKAVRSSLAEEGVSVHHLRVVHDLLNWIVERYLPEMADRCLDHHYDFSYSHSKFSSILDDYDPDSELPIDLIDDDLAYDLEDADFSRTATTGLDRYLDTSSAGGGSLETNDDNLSTAMRSYVIDSLREESPDYPIRADTDDAAEDPLEFSLPGVLENLDVIGAAAAGAWEAVDLERDTRCWQVGLTLDTWLHDASVAFYRELDVEFEPTPDSETWDNWQDIYTPKLALHNTIPADRLAEMTAEVGGGVFMSATLEPHDVFQQVSGLTTVADSHNRPVATATYGLHFPEGNRASVIGALDRYTSGNRGQPTLDPDMMTPTRQAYADVLTRLASTYGNILIAMPNYDEAQWLYRLLGDRADTVGKPILKDESSSHGETQELLDRFKKPDDQHRVLTTGLRGTVTEGVDYPGDLLHTVVVVGVPIANIGDPKMQKVQEAYGQRFGEENAFEYTFGVPAVRKARQAVGRVIRSADDVGARVLLDERYGPRTHNSVHPYLSKQERQEFSVVSDTAQALEFFWDQHDRR